VSMDDDIMRLFGGDRLKSMMERLKVPDDVPLQNPMVSRSIEGAQKRVEGHHFDIRKHVLQYDNVMNKHREIIYTRRQKILEKLDEETGTRDEGLRTKDEGGMTNDQAPMTNGTTVGATQSLHEDVLQTIKREVQNIITLHASGLDSEKWNVQEIAETVAALYPVFRTVLSEEVLRAIVDPDVLARKVEEMVVGFYEEKCAQAGEETVAQAERVVTLRSVDTHWMSHIDEMASLREQVAFSGYAQRDPLIEYQDQAFRKFRELLQNIDATIVRMLLQIDFAQFVPQRLLEEAEAEMRNLATNADQIEGELRETGVKGVTGAHRIDESSVGPGMVNDLVRMMHGRPSMPSPAEMRARQSQKPVHAQKVGRNDPCPCGSGKKFKKCHGT
jgi:preprotein translocase subunit SecA